MYLYACVYVCACVCIYTCVCVCIWVYSCVFGYMRLCVEGGRPTEAQGTSICIYARARVCVRVYGNHMDVWVYECMRVVLCAWYLSLSLSLSLCVCVCVCVYVCVEADRHYCGSKQCILVTPGWIGPGVRCVYMGVHVSCVCV